MGAPASPSRPGTAPRSLVTSLRHVLEMFRVSHSVFALPFALLALVVGAGGQWPPAATLGWVLLALVSARSAAMGVNRIADRRFDAQNPRTAQRHLVTGALSLGFAWGFTLLALALFFVAAWRLGTLALALSPLVMLVLLGYSFLKRFTSLAHLGVGLALGLAPLGAWVAARGHLQGDLAFPLLLGSAVVLWVAGFDVIYACQDVEVDRRLRLHSIPARWGVARSLQVALAMHAGCLALFAAAGGHAGLVRWSALAWALSALLLARAHLLARRAGVGPANAALMPLNGLVAVLLGVAGIVDALARAGA
ncbi:MAG: UbiA-like polyprenyltransferase [Planctomycetia bacterium]